MYEWIDPFAAIAEAERRAEMAHYAACDAEDDAKQKIDAARRMHAYENAHLKAVNEVLFRQVAAFSPPRIMLSTDLGAEAAQMLTATEVAERILQRQGHVTHQSHTEEQRRMNELSSATIAARKTELETKS